METFHNTCISGAPDMGGQVEIMSGCLMVETYQLSNIKNNFDHSFKVMTQTTSVTNQPTDSHRDGQNYDSM